MSLNRQLPRGTDAAAFCSTPLVYTHHVEVCIHKHRSEGAAVSLEDPNGTVKGLMTIRLHLPGDGKGGREQGGWHRALPPPSGPFAPPPPNPPASPPSMTLLQSLNLGSCFMPGESLWLLCQKRLREGEAGGWGANYTGFEANPHTQSQPNPHPQSHHHP